MHIHLCSLEILYDLHSSKNQNISLLIAKKLETDLLAAQFVLKSCIENWTMNRARKLLFRATEPHFFHNFPEFKNSFCQNWRQICVWKKFYLQIELQDIAPRDYCLAPQRKFYTSSIFENLRKYLVHVLRSVEKCDEVAEVFRNAVAHLNADELTFFDRWYRWLCLEYDEARKRGIDNREIFLLSAEER